MKNKKEELPQIGKRYYLDGNEKITGEFIGNFPGTNSGAYFDKILPENAQMFIRDQDMPNLIGFSIYEKFTPVKL